MVKLYAILLLSICSFFFTSAQSYITLGSTSQVSGNEFQVTPPLNNLVGSFWNQTPLDLSRSFSICTEIYLGNIEVGADGIAFVLQPRNTALGIFGRGIGYQSISPSMAIEFDTYYNYELFDAVEDHIGFMRNGEITHGITGNPGTKYSLPNIEDGLWHPAGFSWNAVTKTLTLSYLSKTYSYHEDIVNTMFDGNPIVYWGFTGSTGGWNNDQRVRILSVAYDKLSCSEFTLSGLVTNADCSGANGAVDITVSGGTSPYSFLWDNGSITEDIRNVAPGNYLVKVTDALGVVQKVSFTVGSNDILAPVPDVEELAPTIGECSVTVTAPTATDDCKGVIKGTTSDPLVYENQGVYTVNWIYDDGNGHVVTQKQQVVVMDVTPPVIQGGFEDIILFTDPGKCDAEYLIMSYPSFTDNCRTGSITSNAPSVFAKGKTAITFTARDAAGNEATIEGNVIVLDKQSPTFTAPANTSVNLEEGCIIKVPDLISELSGTDNCGPVAFIQYPAADAIINSAHNQKHVITITCSDEDGNKTVKAVEITAVDVTTPIITAPSDIERHPMDPGKCFATVNLGIPVTEDNCGTLSISNNAPTIFPEGSTTVTWEVMDVAGNSATAIQVVTVVNSVPVISSLNASSDPLLIGSEVTLEVKFSDQNVTSAVVNWNDGSAYTEVDRPAATFKVTHTYNVPGVYTIPVMLQDACGSTIETAFKYVVVYDPSGGFVTGGGWILSPIVSDLPYMNLAGKAHFGFVSKFEQGKNVPGGRTEFQFQVGGLNFKSTLYEWLVISGSRAQFKGSGTINGSGDFGFILTGIDGDMGTERSVDKFRIKIWDKSTGKTVYDNQYMADDNAVASTALDGGSIVIHKANKNTSLVLRDLNQSSEEVYPGKLWVSAMPNPSISYFRLKTQSSSTQELSLRVLDILGRVVEAKSNIAPNTSVLLGSQYRPGIYFVEVLQGAERVTLKLVKN